MPHKFANLILVGSRALALRSQRFKIRDDADFDFVGTESDARYFIEENRSAIKPRKVYLHLGRNLIVQGTVNLEFELVSKRESSRMLHSLVKNDTASFQTDFGLVPSIDLLFALKSSHRYLKDNPHFWKTVHHYHFMKAMGATVKSEHVDFIKLREKETYNYPLPSLDKSKKAFFNRDQIDYKYDHDSIHDAVKLYNRPAYTFFQKDGQEVAVDKSKFDALTNDLKLASVIEESAVLAIERSLVPHPGVLSERQAWMLALSKVCTSITSGWWREFAYENVIDAVADYPKDYFSKFTQGLKSGVIKDFK
jgi:hypothetical protein